MAYEVSGIDLSEGALVYYCINNEPAPLRNYPSICLFMFIFDPYDGLYATVSVRKFWKLHPETHPHVTLFTMLYKKLEMSEI